jgi:membrane-associated protein
MTEAILHFTEQLMSSWWIYLALWAFAALDGFLPAIPSETLVVTAGVFAATGETNLYGVVVVAATGAFVGDHISYALGTPGPGTPSGDWGPGISGPSSRVPVPGHQERTVAQADGGLGDFALL